jgi:23S rRNA (adenine2503-C2)-methyltransferase
MTSLPCALRGRLARELPILAGSETERRVAPDGTTKLLIAFPSEGGREGAAEAVYIRSSTPGRGATLCVSTQAGCPVGCPFCASGQAGLARNLEAHEIVEQFARGRALGPVARAVAMGMGEPLLNWDNLARALAVIHDEMGLGARRVTVSTVGFPERLVRAARGRPRCELAISLHSPDQEQRDRLVPAMRGVPIADVIAAGDEWFRETGREVTYEYALLGGENDAIGHAERLATLLGGRRATVNLIPYNPVEGGAFERPAAASVERFRAALERRGLVATVRWSKGLAADAACGQLRLRRARGAPERA